MLTIGLRVKVFLKPMKTKRRKIEIESLNVSFKMINKMRLDIMTRKGICNKCTLLLNDCKFFLDKKLQEAGLSKVVFTANYKFTTGFGPTPEKAMEHLIGLLKTEK